MRKMRSQRATIMAGLASLLLLALGGCAMRGSDYASAMVPVPPVGSWRGTISGHDMSDTAGPRSADAALTISEDGTFALQDSSGARATGRADVAGNALLLDGAFVSPPDRAGEPVVNRLYRGRDDALYGSVQTLFRGLKITGAGVMGKER